MMVKRRQVNIVVSSVLNLVNFICFITAQTQVEIEAIAIDHQNSTLILYNDTNLNRTDTLQYNVILNVSETGQQVVSQNSVSHNNSLLPLSSNSSQTTTTSKTIVEIETVSHELPTNANWSSPSSTTYQVVKAKSARNPQTQDDHSKFRPLLYYMTTTHSPSITPPLSLAPKFVAVGSEHLENRTATVRGIRIEDANKGVSYENRGISIILANSVAVLRLFGDRFTKHSIIRFVTEMGNRGSDCDDLTSTRSFSLYRTDLTPHSALANIQLPPLDVGEQVFYICVRENNTDMPWVHQGLENWVQLQSYTTFLPLWVHISILAILLILSGLFSGLNLGLMAIDRTDIQIIANTGTEKERRDAKKIQPLRANGNYLLCSLLLGNVLVNSTLTILLDDLTTGIIAIVGSTLGIVIFGEIVPQAFCSRHGLAVGAQTIWLTKFCMAIFFPVAYPVSQLLDKILGKEIGNVYNRERLKELIKVTHQYNDLEKDEVNIIAGALELKQKTVCHIMTKRDDIFMLRIDAILDFDTVSEIISQGYSRIPVYENERNQVVSLLLTKDLAFVDPDDRMPLRTICEFYNNPVNYVFDTTTLDVLFKEFQQGVRGHMAFVHKLHTDEKGDPYYDMVGLVTMEDVIEALIKAEINDETDVLDINRRRRSRATTLMNSDMTIMKWKSAGIKNVSPQLALAAFQYLSTSIEQFHDQRISKTILHRLLNQNLFFQLKVKNKENVKNDPSYFIYERGKPADYFVLILEGRVQAEMGKEGLIFESGPFTFFGTQSLNQNVGVGEAPLTPSGSRKSICGLTHYNPVNLESLLYSTFVPDYTVKAVTDVTFLRISRSIYMAAKQATLLERTFTDYLGDTFAQDRDKVGDNFEEQIDKMMNFDKGKRGSKSIEIAHLNYFRRVNSFRSAQAKNEKSGRRGSELFSELILRPNLLISDYDKEENLTRHDRRISIPIENDLNATPTSDSPNPDSNNDLRK